LSPPRDDTVAFEHRLHAHFDLIAIARPSMEDVHQFVGERGVVVFVTDRNLCVLDLVGGSSLQELMQACGMQRGVFLSEECVGTNAAAMALSEGLPVQVVGPEHYCVACHIFTDTAAPIHAPNGELLGVLGIATLEEDGCPHSLGVAMAAAKAIENQLQADLSLSEAHQRHAELDVALEALSKGILSLDLEGRVTHINARGAATIDKTVLLV
jgi:transcriptional regulator of acetoin/glycerol metabolism